jgi:uncharacterized membrane protein
VTRTYILSFIVSALVFLALDFVWLSTIAAEFYKQQIGEHLADKPDFTAAGFFYLIYLAGLVYFVVVPALAKGQLGTAVLSGAFFGLVCYATYDLTNMATMRNWPLTVTLVDLAWGMFVSAAAATAAYIAVRRFG